MVAFIVADTQNRIAVNPDYVRSVFPTKGRKGVSTLVMFVCNPDENSHVEVEGEYSVVVGKLSKAVSPYVGPR